ncbi:MAG: hypothetical protein OIF40_16820, partial [Mangrovicoccus sp.]|nr:hypothetical protein [Mangrovicoccus sp.]
NAWTTVDIDYVVTANTVLRFDFSSTDQGEIHGVEFDNDGLPSSNYGFQLFGTQTIYHQDFNNYRLSDGTKTYEIAVGEFFTGSFDSLVFFSDDDRVRGSNSTFSNIELFEDTGNGGGGGGGAPSKLKISGQSYDIAAFAHQNPNANHSLTDGGDTLVQGTNAWTEVDIDYVVTENTVLRFEFSSTDEGEIHGVEFDNDGLPSGDYGFQLFGTQTIYHQDFNNYRLSDGTKTYEIAVGEFFTGSFDSLVFFSDDDRGRGSNSTFSNIELFEDGSTPPP